VCVQHLSSQRSTQRFASLARFQMPVAGWSLHSQLERCGIVVKSNIRNRSQLLYGAVACVVQVQVALVNQKAYCEAGGPSEKVLGLPVQVEYHKFTCIRIIRIMSNVSITR
jgi:hypothetical protein